MRKNIRGFTLVELMMGMFITSITGMAVAGVSMVLSTAYSHSEDHYDSMESARSMTRRVQFSLQSASLVTAIDNNGTKLVYWAGDADGNDQINSTELRLLKYDSLAKTLTEYRVEYPSDWLIGHVDAEFSLKNASDMSAIESWILNSTYLKSLVYATGVEKFCVTVSPKAPLATLVEMQFAFGSGDQAVMLRSAAALRADMTRFIGLAADDYMLMIP